MLGRVAITRQGPVTPEGLELGGGVLETRSIELPCLVPGSPQSKNARRDVGPHERRRVADVSRLVRCDAAHVDASPPEDRKGRLPLK